MRKAICEFPQLQTLPTPTLVELINKFYERQSDIEAWFAQHWQQTPPPFYASVDLRNAGFKVTPVDTNLFPAGFNNLDATSFLRAVEAVKITLKKAHPECEKILLIPESHTRNQRYLENVVTLQEILQEAGFTVRVGSLLEDLKEPQQVTLSSGHTLVIEPLHRQRNTLQGNTLGINSYEPCIILLNNDLAEGIPEILQNLNQPIIPPVHTGWFTRLKSNHFKYYEQIATDFANHLGFDPWLICPYYKRCTEVNFMTREGEECLITQAKEIYHKIQAKYREYQIAQEPFIVVKANQGTYGMGVLPITNPDDLRNLNRKERTRMAVTKGGQRIEDVIIQEGVHTLETIGADKHATEPVIYLVGQNIVGGFYRVHPKRSINQNLNAPGMHFAAFAFADYLDTNLTKSTKTDKPIETACQRGYFYAVLARLATLAAAHEYKNSGKDL